MPRKKRLSDQRKIGECVLAERKRTSTPIDLRALRRSEIMRLLVARHEGCVPDPAVTGDREYSAGFLNSIATTMKFDDADHFDAWVDRHAPWADADDWQAALRFADSFRKPPSPREIADLIGLSFEERIDLGIKNIGVAGWSTAKLTKAMADRRRENNAVRMAKARREYGAVSRERYRASVRSSQPWLAEGISRRTWFRRQKR